MKFLQDWSPLRTRYCSIEPFTMMALGTGLQAGGSIFSGIMGRSAAKKQATAIRAAQDQAQKYNDMAAGELRSFRERGDTAGGLLADLLSGKLDPDAVLKASSLFKFQEQEGSKALNRQLKARGLYGSGAGLEALQKFENQLVGEEGDKQYGRLFQLSEQGRLAGAQIAANDLATGNTVANLEAARGGALAAGDQAMGQGISGALNAVAGGGMQYMNYEMLKPILAKLGGGKGSDYTEEQALAIQQESLGRGLAFGAQNQWYQDQKDHAGMLADGVSWTSSGF